MADLRQLNALLGAIECSRCQQIGGLKLSSCPESRQGFAVRLLLHCALCGYEFGQEYSSPHTNMDRPGLKPFAINDILVMFFNQSGMGHTGMNLLGALLGSKVLHLKTFQDKENRLIDTIVDATEDVLQRSAQVVREAYLELNPDTSDSPLDITVSFDGTWHKRGHTSLYGVGAVIDVLTGLVLDYTVCSKYCHACTLKEAEFGSRNCAEFEAWFANQEADCCADYKGSSNAMEAECARRLWSRSIDLHNIRYTGMLGDGDSKAFRAVTELAPYPDVTIEREECVNHAHKRLGTALLNLMKTAKLGGRGHGRLTQTKALTLQGYYRGAITSHIGDADGMRHAVWASLLHCMSTDDDPHHTRCPPGSESWCFFQGALAEGTEPGPHAEHLRHPLAYEVAEAMLPIYTRMSDPNLMQRLAKGKTQNPNECLHSVVWSRCPKTVFVGRHKLHGAVASAVSAFNTGASQLTDLMRRMAIEINKVTLAYAEEKDRVRMQRASKGAHEEEKERRLAKQARRKEERAADTLVEGPTYVPGGF